MRPCDLKRIFFLLFPFFPHFLVNSLEENRWRPWCWRVVAGGYTAHSFFFLLLLRSSSSSPSNPPLEYLFKGKGPSRQKAQVPSPFFFLLLLGLCVLRYFFPRKKVLFSPSNDKWSTRNDRHLLITIWTATFSSSSFSDGHRRCVLILLDVVSRLFTSAAAERFSSSSSSCIHGHTQNGRGASYK